MPLDGPRDRQRRGGDIAYDESVDGDPSDLGPDPTFVVFTQGVNNLLFVTDPGPDRDIFKFTIAEGYELAGLVTEGPGTK